MYLSTKFLQLRQTCKKLCPFPVTQNVYRSLPYYPDCESSDSGTEIAKKIQAYPPSVTL